MQALVRRLRCRLRGHHWYDRHHRGATWYRCARCGAVHYPDRAGADRRGGPGPTGTWRLWT